MFNDENIYNGNQAERAKGPDSKNKRQEDWKKIVKKKLKDEEEKVIKESDKNDNRNVEIYKLFNDLQGISKDFLIPFEIPELVVVGNQSDGKSSFIEGLLGFQFNIVSSNIGTRRPLVLQMINNPALKQPSCRFRREKVQQDNEDAFEVETPVHMLSEEILARTNRVAGRGDVISPVPIILRVEYCNCANLTIWDLPGFRLGGDSKLSAQIQLLAEKVMKQKNKIIVSVEQSSIEWANSTSRPLISKIDPNFNRTILVNTKFDNRVKELRSKEEAGKYLAGEGLPDHSKPFFISLPVQRGLDSQTYKQSMISCYLKDYSFLLKAQFDEARFLHQIGFFRVKNYLEDLLREKLLLNLKPTWNCVEIICNKTKLEIENIQSEITSINIESIKAQSLSYVQKFTIVVEKLLEGSIIGEPDTYGQTLDEEHRECGVDRWPEFRFRFDIANKDIKLYGGAQIQRLMNEFEYVAHSIEFPKTSINEVASSIGISKVFPFSPYFSVIQVNNQINQSHNLPGYETAASDIVKMKAKNSLFPLIRIVLERCSYILKRLFNITNSVILSEGEVSVNDLFLSELEKIFEAFLNELSATCMEKMFDDFNTLTTVIDWDLFYGVTNLDDESYNYLSPSKEDTICRVSNLMENHSRSYSTEESTAYDKVRLMAARLFSGIRFFFVKFIKNKISAFFLDPLFQLLNGTMANHFRKLPDGDYERMFNLGVKEKEEHLALLQTQLQRCEMERDRFRQIMAQLAIVSP